METKKNKKYDLERKRPLFFGVGMIISLSLTLVAFEWKSEIEPIVLPKETEDDGWVVMYTPIVTEHDQPKPPRPKKEKKEIIRPASIIKETTEVFSKTENTVIDQGEDLIYLTEEDFGTEEIDKDEPFLFVEEMPSFPGGERALMEYIATHVKYPRKARNLNVEGRVTLSFVIGKDGTVTDVKIIKGIGAGCDEEATRVLESLPRFSPGKQRGKPVKVQMQVPVLFKLH